MCLSRPQAPTSKSLADEDGTARKTLLSDLRIQLSTVVFALGPPFSQVELKRIPDARTLDLVLPLGWRICSSQPGHSFPAQADALGNSSVAVSVGLERLDLFVACPLTVRAGLLFTLPPGLRWRERWRETRATCRLSAPDVVLVRRR
jgi:hypothetical protein